jgi:hypothetical protein
MAEIPRHAFYPRRDKTVRHRPDGNYCKATGRLLYGGQSLFFDVAFPGKDGISVCVCVRCKRFSNTVCSQEFSWSWIIGRIREAPTHSGMAAFETMADGSFCRSCHQKIRAEMRRAVEATEINHLINKIKGATKNGANQNNRAASSVSSRYAYSSEKRANGN